MATSTVAPETLYAEAIQEFEACNYDSAVQKLINLYVADFNKDLILGDLYNCFVVPNEPEFAETYKRSNSPLPYEDLSLDFIPVSDAVYYIFDKRAVSFRGKIDLNPYLNRQYDKRTFQSLLICDLWNPLHFLRQYCGKEYQHVYISLMEECESLFYSFFKLPEFASLLDRDRTLIFADRSAYSDFMYHHPEYYLPSLAHGDNVDIYRRTNQEIHSYRLAHPSPDNVFLTIGIPSYNRGHLALESVKQLLTLEYDSEIEIYISNNGSENNTEGYEEIAALPDSRITYHKMDTNRRVWGNITQILSAGKGRFVMLASDEDRMYLENLDAYLDFLYDHADAGMIIPSGSGGNMFPRKEVIQTDLSIKLCEAFGCNYLTGLTFRSLALKENNAFPRVTNTINSDNRFALSYPHTLYAIVACEQKDLCTSDILMWYEAHNLKSNLAFIPQSIPLENRIKQQDAAVSLIFDFINAPLAQDDYMQVFYARMKKTYHVLWVAFKILAETMAAEYDWMDVCIEVFEHNKPLIQSYCDKLGQPYVDFLLAQNNALLREYVMKNPSKSVQTPEQQRSFTERRDALLNKLGTNPPIPFP